LLPQTVLAELAYLVGRNAGIGTVVAFLQGLSVSRFSLVALTDQDVIRVAEILDEYADSRIDFVDVSVMAIAERYGIKKIFTLDQRDFRLYRPQHCDIAVPTQMRYKIISQGVGACPLVSTFAKNSVLIGCCSPAREYN
jgi:predicted nucleic-acid-binding protein